MAGSTAPSRVLCLRAPNEASSLLAGLAAHGLRGVPLEVLQYRECWDESEGASSLVRGLNTADCVVLTSKRGVRAWCNLCAAAGANAPSVAVAVVGSATAHEAGDAGLSVRLVGDSDALALAERLATAGPTSSGRILFAVAREATREPQDFLVERGFAVSRLEIYESVVPVDLPARVAAFEPEAFAGLVATSANRLDAFFSALPQGSREAWLELPFIVIGHRTAERARQLGATCVAVASGASTERLVDAAATVLVGPPTGAIE